MKGISSLSRVTGQEHDQICRFLLGLVIDICLPNGHSNARLLRSVRALLDFLYLAQYLIHTTTTLKLLDDALVRFHANKDIFVDLGICDRFNIPKLHFASHYVELIKMFGTTNNFNTQYTDRLHIDLTKDAYATTNRKDEFGQMTMWLEQKEKVLRHAQYVDWHLSGSSIPEQVCWIPPGLDMQWKLSIAKHPSTHAVSHEWLRTDYRACFFLPALRRFISLSNKPQQIRPELEESLWNVMIPFTTLPIWHVIKFLRTDPITRITSTADSIHSQPARHDKHGHVISERFDTTLLNNGSGGNCGAKGAFCSHLRAQSAP